MHYMLFLHFILVFILHIFPALMSAKTMYQQFDNYVPVLLFNFNLTIIWSSMDYRKENYNACQLSSLTSKTHLIWS